MTSTHNTAGKGKIIIYWIATGLLAAGMFAGAVAQLMHARENVEGFHRLGYPEYMMSILGTWKILGVITLLLPGLRLVKEWAYAGFFFLMTGAVISHLASGESISSVIAQIIFVLLVAVSWVLRPASRKIIPAQR